MDKELKSVNDRNTGDGTQDVKQRMEELIRLIEYHNNRYYNLDDPEISDYEYDQLYLELTNLEQAYPQLKRKDSPTQKVGGIVKRELKKVVHDVPVISLQDVFSKNEVIQFVERIRQELRDPVFVVEKRSTVYRWFYAITKAISLRVSPGGMARSGNLYMKICWLFPPYQKPSLQNCHILKSGAKYICHLRLLKKPTGNKRKQEAGYIRPHVTLLPAP